MLRDVPVLLVGGARDRDSIIPVAHTVRAHALLLGSRLEIFDDAGNFPHTKQPIRFARIQAEFIAITEPARSDRESLRRQMADTGPVTT